MEKGGYAYDILTLRGIPSKDRRVRRSRPHPSNLFFQGKLSNVITRDIPSGCGRDAMKLVKIGFNLV
jgi:hypothetical protein